MSKFKYISYVVFLIVLMCGSVFGVTYSWYSENIDKNEKKENLIDVYYKDNSLINISDLTSILKYENAYKKTFIVKHGEKNNKNISYYVDLEIDNIENIESTFLKYELIDLENNKIIKVGYITDNKKYNLLNKDIKFKEEDKFELRIWVDRDIDELESSLLSAHLIVESK